MTTLSFGVIDIPYGQQPGGRGENSGVTTGDVAEILEAHYHIYETFWELHHAEIMQEVEKSYLGAINNLSAGQTQGAFNPLAGAAEEIQIMFSNFLNAGEMEQLGIGGQYPVPTGAALRGVNHRKKHPYAKRAPRKSFVDTGLYEASFRVWEHE